jgi:hypothetical protein
MEDRKLFYKEGLPHGTTLTAEISFHAFMPLLPAPSPSGTMAMETEDIKIWKCQGGNHQKRGWLKFD